MLLRPLTADDMTCGNTHPQEGSAVLVEMWI